MAKKFNHNNRQERTKFNPAKFGSTWASIFWKGKPGLSPQGDANQPVIVSINISGKEFDLTFSECNKLIETLIDAKEAARTSKRLGMDRTTTPHVSFMDVVSDMQQNR